MTGKTRRLGETFFSKGLDLPNWSACDATAEYVVCASSLDGTISVVNLVEDEKYEFIGGHESSVTSLTIKGDLAASGSYDSNCPFDHVILIRL